MFLHAFFSKRKEGKEGAKKCIKMRRQDTLGPPSFRRISQKKKKNRQWRLHNCGNTTEATTLLQQFIKKKNLKRTVYRYPACVDCIHIKQNHDRASEQRSTDTRKEGSVLHPHGQRSGTFASTAKDRGWTRTAVVGWGRETLGAAHCLRKRILMTNCPQRIAPEALPLEEKKAFQNKKKEDQFLGRGSDSSRTLLVRLTRTTTNQ